jgi:NADPH2:quinone reductase
VHLPDGVGFDIGACLGIPAMTAHRAVHADGPVRGQLLLVTGGAGRVGYYAIQFAKLAGATVIATAHGARGEADCREAGADHVVDHRAPDWHRAVLAASGGRRIDRVVDVEFGANLPQVLELIRTGGVIATYSSTVVPEPSLPFRRMMWMDLSVRMIIVYSIPEAAKEHAALDITEALRAGRLRHRIAKRYPLEQFVAASEAIEKGGVNGCVVVDI